MTSSNNNDEEKKLQQQLHPREEPESIEADRVGGWREPNQPRRINNKRNRGYRREAFPNVEQPNDEELGKLKEEEDKKINEEYKDITDPKDPGDLLTPENLYNKLTQSIDNPIQYDKPEPTILEQVQSGIQHARHTAKSRHGFDTLDVIQALIPKYDDPAEMSEYTADLAFTANVSKWLPKQTKPFILAGKRLHRELGEQIMRHINKLPPTGLAAVTDTGDIFRIPWDPLTIDYDKFIRTKQLFPNRYNYGDELDSPSDWADSQKRIETPSKNPGPEVDWNTDVSKNLQDDINFQNTWGTDSQSAADKIDEAINYARRNSDQDHTLKGFNNEWYDQNGVQFRVVRDTSVPINLKEGLGYRIVPEINYQQARMIRRSREAIPKTEVIQYLQELRPDWSPQFVVQVADAYKKYVVDGNKALTRVSQAWNKAVNGPFMSIDHLKDLKSGGRNIPTNRRLMPKIPNSAKNATAAYREDILTALGARWNLKEDIAAFIDPDIAGFWKFIDSPGKTRQLIDMTAKGWDTNDAINIIEQGIGTSMNPAQYRTYISKTAGKASIPLPEYPHKPPKPKF